MDNQNPQDPNQGGQVPVVDPGTGQTVPEPSAPEAPVEVPATEAPAQPAADPVMPEAPVMPTEPQNNGGDQPGGGAPVV